MSGYYFISYSSLDEALALGLVEQLEASGVSCWIAKRDLSSGSDYSSVITGRISESDGIVLLLSKNSDASDDVKKELILAGKRKKPIFPYAIPPGFQPDGLEYLLVNRQIHPLSEAVERLTQGRMKFEGSTADGAKIKFEAQGLMRNRGMSRIVALGGIAAVVAIFAIWVFRPQPTQVVVPAAPAYVAPAPPPAPVAVQQPVKAAPTPLPAPAPVRAPEPAPRQEPVKREEPSFATVPSASGGALRPRTSLEGYAPPPKAKDTHGIVPEDSSGPLRPRFRLE